MGEVRQRDDTEAGGMSDKDAGEMQAAIDCAFYLLKTDDLYGFAPSPDILPEQRIKLAMGMIWPYTTVGREA